MRIPTVLTVLLPWLWSCQQLEPAVDPADIACGGDEAVVEIATEDDLVLRADLWPGPADDAPGIVLFHMKPPTYDRTGYPAHVREELADAGATVLNVDRRGGGESEGEGEDAYVGDGARLDMEASVRFLEESGLGCPVDTARLLLVGASNGTTAVMDYTVAREPDRPSPAALVWMSPGEYTENQHAVADHRDLLDPMPLLWLYPTTEPWSLDFVDGAADTWMLVERGEEHGTDMFDGGELEQQTLDDIVGWVHDHVY